MAETISPDYLVIGAGAMGMAFVDTLITDTKATVAIVDRYNFPGGHWTIAYPFVTLHQPSSVYGVNSRPLGDDKIDQVGLKKGLRELATGDEVVAYFRKVMHQTLLPSGRVTYYPKHEYLGDGKFQSILTNNVYQVGPDTRIVDATFMKAVVPAMRPPAYEVSEGVNLIAPNGLATLSRSYGAYTVVGAGKTGIDACIWLLTNGIDPKNITWIMPRDPWLLNRKSLQVEGIPAVNAKESGDIGAALMNATSYKDLFLRLEATRQVMRIDENNWPTMFRCPVVSELEFERVKKIETIIRQGRITRISTTEVTLEKGKYESVPDTLYIDCSADGLAKLKSTPVFNGKLITLQSLRLCQQVFSAAVIAHIEASYDDDEVKNSLSGPVQHAFEPKDLVKGMFRSLQNEAKWAAEPKMASWLDECRLNVSMAKSGAQAGQVTEPDKLSAHRVALINVVAGKMESLMV